MFVPHSVLQCQHDSRRANVVQVPLVCHPQKPFGMLQARCAWLTGLRSHCQEPGWLAELWWSHKHPGLGRQSSAAGPSQVRSCHHQGAIYWLWLTLQKLFVLSGTSFGNISRNQRLHRGQGYAGLHFSY